MEHVNPHHASRFFRNPYKEFGSRVNYQLNARVWTHIGYARTSGAVREGDLIPPTGDCDPSWPTLYLRHQLEKNTNKHRRNHPDWISMVVGDENCRCSVTECGRLDHVPLREYYSEKLSNSKWLPLGPRFEFIPITDKQRAKDPLKRKVPYNFVGSESNAPRKLVGDMYYNKKITAKYPVFRDGVVRLMGRWHKDQTNKGGMSPWEFRTLLLNSTFTLAVAGHNYDTYRMYEAIEAGSIPIVEVGTRYLHQPCSKPLDKLISSGAPFVYLNNWKELPDRLEREFANPEGIRKRHKALIEWRRSFYTNASRTLECTFFEQYKLKTGSSPLNLEHCDQVVT